MDQWDLKLFFILSCNHSQSIRLGVVKRKVPSLMSKDLLCVVIDDLLVLQCCPLCLRLGFIQDDNVATSAVVVAFEPDGAFDGSDLIRC